MAKTLEKDANLLRLLAELRVSLGDHAFDIVDHWEADLQAIGIASPRNHGVLAYLSIHDCDTAHCNVELELPAATGQDDAYLLAGNHWNVELNDIVKIIREHLSRADR